MELFNMSRPESYPVLKKVYAIMRLTTLALIVFSLNISATVYSQNTKLSLDVSNQSIKEILFLIESQSEFRFIYESGKINLDKKVSVRVEEQPVEVILNSLFAKEGVKYEITQNNLILINPTEKNKYPDTQKVVQKKKQITGMVTDEKGEPIIGANIVEKGTTNGTITDIDGKFSLEVDDKSMLLVSYIGYNTKNISISNKSSYTIDLSEDAKTLDEVVVIGYGTQKKVNLTGSVATINSDDIKELPSSNLSNALSGRLAGVTFTQSTGKPGASASVAIRAEGTWNSTAPLYVIDGVVRDKFAFDGLDASEVENLSVLKDGASAAIYGSRAANGVIVVTTKKGKIGKPKISYSGSVGFSDATKIPEVLNGYDQAILINDKNRVQDVDPSDMKYYTEDELEYLYTNRDNFNMLDEAWKQSLVTRHTVNVSGGNEAVRYFVGGSYFYENGTFENLSYNKYNLRSNLEANITKNLVASLNINMDMRDDHKPFWKWDDDKETLNNLYRGLLTRASSAPAYIDGKPNGTFLKWHPLEVVNGSTGYNKKKWSSYDATISLQYNIPFIEGLSLKLMYNKFDRHTFVKQFNRPYPLYTFETAGSHNHICTDVVKSVTIRNDGDYLYEKYNKDNNYQLNGIITYSHTFGKHDVGGMFIYEQSEGTLDWFDGQRNYYISSVVDQLFAGSSDTKDSSVNGKGEENGRLSYVGRVNYGYDEKYLLEASFRYDGSVNFAPSKRWGFFPSASAAWRISEENFFKNNVRFVDYLKVRASVGLLGNDAIVLEDQSAISGWQWQQSYNIVEGAYFGGLSSGLSAGVLPNPNITWEKSVSYNGGLDAQLFKNKLSLNADFFFRHTYDILGNRLASLPTTFGANMPSENYAVMDSKGFEIEVGYQDKIGSDFRYWVKGNLGYAKNKIIEKDEAENLRAYKTTVGLNSNRKMGYVATDVIRTQADLDALPDNYLIFGAKPELGMLNYKDLRSADSDIPDGKIDENDQEWIINYTTPPINYGFSLGAEWKGFGVDLFFQGVAGSKRLIDVRGTGWLNEEAPFAFWKDHWTPENPNAEFPRAERNCADSESTFWVRDASFLRLKNVNFSYTVPKSVTSKLKIEQLKLFLTGTNLFLLQNKIKYYDPENSSIADYPNMRNYSFGINLSF